LGKNQKLQNQQKINHFFRKEMKIIDSLL